MSLIFQIFEDSKEPSNCLSFESRTNFKKQKQVVLRNLKKHMQKINILIKMNVMILLHEQNNIKLFVHIVKDYSEIVEMFSC